MIEADRFFCSWIALEGLELKGISELLLSTGMHAQSMHKLFRIQEAVLQYLSALNKTIIGPGKLLV